MDASNTLLHIFLELEHSTDRFSLSTDVINTQLPVWIYQGNGRTGKTQRLEFVDPSFLIPTLVDQGVPHRVFGDFDQVGDENQYLANSLLMVGDCVPSRPGYAFHPLSFVDVATICAEQNTGIGLATAADGWYLASAQFLKPVVNVILRLVRNKIRNDFREKACSFQFTLPDEVRIQALLDNNAVFAQSLDAGVLDMGSDKALVLCINVRDDIDITPDELTHLKASFRELISFDGFIAVIHSMGEPRNTNPHIHRMNAACTVDFSRLLD
ncbi:MAG TPA: hypothetical protein PKB15_07750 [Acidimicrobiia bacterium]|nr:hypothetical protein [Acidimicrobiia bacterium]